MHTNLSRAFDYIWKCDYSSYNPTNCYQIVLEEPCHVWLQSTNTDEIATILTFKWRRKSSSLINTSDVSDWSIAIHTENCTVLQVVFPLVTGIFRFCWKWPNHRVIYSMVIVIRCGPIPYLEGALILWMDHRIISSRR